jgi:glycosyltransferase involved in cell wall biosynthesis
MSKARNKSATITWIDLTDFLSWRGHFTGIQRVVYSYACRFVRDGSAKLFVYDAVDKRFVEVGTDFLRKISSSSDSPNMVRTTIGQKVKQRVGVPYHALPEGIKSFVQPFVALSAGLTHAFLHQFVYRGAKSAFRSYVTADFSADDEVVLLGASWNEAGLIELLCTIRKERGIKIIQHLNDILPIYQPHLFDDSLPKIFIPYVETAIRNADKITVISEATKRDVEAFCRERGIRTPPISVIRLGEDVPVVKPRKPAGLEKNSSFVLSVGTMEIRKNYMLLYQAAKLAQLEGRDFPNVVIAGRKGWLTRDLTHVIAHDPFTQGRIQWLQDVSDEEIAWLYDHCMFTVFPSLCEGWGLPIVESLQHGKTCITSNISSMLEIGQGLVDYFSPYDARSCMEKIQEHVGTYVLESENVHKKYRVYTWEESYKKFKEAIDTQA